MTAERGEAAAGRPGLHAGALLALLAGGGVAVTSVLIDLVPGAGGGGIFGVGQAVEFLAGIAVLMLGLDLRRGEGAAWATSFRALASADAVRLLVVGVQLVAMVFVAGWFQIESPAFAKQVVPLTAFAFLIHHLLPRPRRLAFFVVVSLISFVVVLGWANAAWLFAVVGLFVALCHVPVSWPRRLGLLCLAAAGLAVLRVRPEWAPFSGALWPVIASILMFRLMVYWYDVRHAKTPPPATWSLAYFFLLPNVVFPLFPVVDFATLRRTYYDQDPFRIYQRGLDWILRGLVHLILYRLVYQHLTLPPEEVDTGAKLVRYMVSTFLLYLRVSGTFHLIVGSLHLFGFRLPETHRFFYLATSFTDFWRRINIYWKDFMQKLVFLPVYFPLRKRGETTALVAGTLVVFFITWLTHAYQWFWILGTGLWSATDALFWAVLGVMLVANSLWEAKKGRTRVLPGAARRRWPDALRNGFKAAGVFAVICTLWTMWGSPTIGDWLDLMSVRPFTATDWAAVLGVLATVVVAGFVADLTGRSAGEQDTAAGAAAPTFARHALRTTAGFALVSLAATPFAAAPFGERGQEFARELRFPELNKRDAQAMQRGYYENLQGVGNQNSQLWQLYAQRPTEGQDIWTSGVLVQRDDWIAREMKPLFGIFQAGRSFRTNRWGMRDREYEQAKPAGTFRFALLGQSYVAGDGVSDGETFDELVEDRLTAEAGPADPAVEILNFGVGAFSAAQQLLYLDSAVFAFAPDVVVRIAHPGDAERIALHSVQLLRRGVAPPWPWLDSILVRERVTGDLRETEALSRLAASRDEMLGRVEARFVEAVHARGARVAWVYLDLPERNPVRAHVDSMAAIARAAGYDVVLDWSDVYDGIDKGTLRASTSDYHPNAAGHRLFAERFYRDVLGAPALRFPRPLKETP